MVLWQNALTIRMAIYCHLVTVYEHYTVAFFNYAKWIHDHSHLNACLSSSITNHGTPCLKRYTLFSNQKILAAKFHLIMVNKIDFIWIIQNFLPSSSDFPGHHLMSVCGHCFLVSDNSEEAHQDF